MFTNIEYFGYDVNNPSSIPQSIRDCLFLNYMEQIQGGTYTLENTELLQKLSNTNSEEDIVNYYTKLLSQVISIFGDNKSEDNSDKDIDIFSILYNIDISYWNYPLPALLMIRKNKYDELKYRELRLFHIVEQAVKVTIPTDDSGQKIINIMREEFLNNFFDIKDEVKNNLKALPDNVKKFPDKLPSFGSMINKPVISEKNI